ncbi:hypothetical protein KXV50_005830, partial [Aspergillus fumigatus]
IYRASQGPMPASAYTQSHGGVIYVDLTDAMKRLTVAFNVYGDEVKHRALYNAINKLGDKLLTAVRRDLVQTTGAKYGRVMKAVHADRAHPNRLFYRIVASDKAMKVSDFARSLTPGKKNPSAKPWNRSQRFKGAFVIRFKNGATEIVKRIGKHNKSGKIRTLWGPIIPKEMIRPGNPSTYHIASAIPTQLGPVLMHELEQAVIRAKAASGT